ncbi:ZUFSP [Mytilus edulis]|uniref:Zinc finger-containing ubiquitin peptidase 1 n=1 Tax=Mytilus edulis TaxID=6550 RepID=A0A8S3SM61_MYTED|nr:ZUFSP [Mytilus edulis]
MAEGGKSNDDYDTFTCLICGQNGFTEPQMREHVMMEHVEQEVYCPFCDLGGITANEMNLHINKAHLDECFSPDGASGTDFEFQEGTSDSGCCSPIEKDVKKPTNGILGSMDCSTSKVLSSDPESLGKKKSRLCLNVASVSGIVHTNNNERNPVLASVVSDRGAVQNGRNVPPARAGGSGDQGLIIPDINDNVEPDINSNIPSEFTCPLCRYCTDSEGQIQSHVNSEHVDILSPENGLDGGDDDSRYMCPICTMSFFSSQELQVHVNAKHMDILSPDKSHRWSDGTDNINGSAEDIHICPMCDEEFHETALLEIHVNGHFSAEQTPVLIREINDMAVAEELMKNETDEKEREEKDFQALQNMYGMTEGKNYKKQYEKNLGKAVFRGDITIGEYHQQVANMKGRDLHGIDDGHSCTKDVIERISKYDAQLSNITNFWLCTDIMHYAASYGDKGWGCGYRNFQMLLSSLATNPTYCKILFNGKPQIPSIPKIQRLIEAAWEKGFDKQGCEQLGGRVVDSTKWIGATEIAATLFSLKVKCRLLDFHSPSGPQGTHPRLFQWVKDYFQQPTMFKPPLYLQHQGHSRTIVGVEELTDKSLRLLIFDPSTSKKQMQQFLTVINSTIMRTIRRTEHGLRAKQYQIVAVEGFVEDKEYDEQKVLKSERVS